MCVCVRARARVRACAFVCTCMHLSASPVLFRLFFTACNYICNSEGTLTSSETFLSVLEFCALELLGASDFNNNLAAELDAEPDAQRFDDGNSVRVLLRDGAC